MWTRINADADSVPADLNDNRLLRRQGRTWRTQTSQHRRMTMTMMTTTTARVMTKSQTTNLQSDLWTITSTVYPLCTETKLCDLLLYSKAGGMAVAAWWCTTVVEGIEEVLNGLLVLGEDEEMVAVVEDEEEEEPAWFAPHIHSVAVVVVVSEDNWKRFFCCCCCSSNCLVRAACFLRCRMTDRSKMAAMFSSLVREEGEYRLVSVLPSTCTGIRKFWPNMRSGEMSSRASTGTVDGLLSLSSRTSFFL